MVMVPLAEPYLGLDSLKLAVAPFLLPMTAAVLSSTCWAVCAMVPRLIIAAKAIAKIFFISLLFIVLKLNLKAFALSGRIGSSLINPGCCPGLGAFALSGRLERMLSFALYLSLRPVTVGSGLSYEFLSCISNVLSWFSSCRSTSLGLLP